MVISGFLSFINQSLSFILNKIIQIDHAPQLAVTY